MVERETSKEEKDTGTYKIKGTLVEYGDGTIQKTKMFDILDVPLDDYSDLEFSLEEVRRMRMHVMKMRTGVQAMAPILCVGSVKCVFRHRCPIVDRNIRTPDGEIDFRNQNVKSFPILRQCPLERDFLDFKRNQYIDEYEIDVDSPTEMGMINKLAELDLYDYRTTLVLANGDDKGEGVDLLKKQVTGTSITGEKMMRLEAHPAFELKERIQKMRENILEAMVGTRRERYKQAAALKQQDTDDPSTSVADLRERIAKLEHETAIDAEFTDIAEEKK